MGHADSWSHEDPADEKLPKKIESLQEPALKLEGGGIHNAILTKSGKVLTFGCGSDGRLGHP